MKKKKSITSIIVVVSTLILLLSGGGSEQQETEATTDPSHIDIQNYGFLSNYGMSTWVEVNDDSLYSENPYASFTEKGHDHHIYKFENNIVYFYNRSESGKYTDNHDLTSTLSSTNTYTIINNDAISVGGVTWTIIDRFYNDAGNLVLSVMRGSTKRNFILAEQIDFNKSPAIEDTEDPFYKKFIYYFK